MRTLALLAREAGLRVLRDCLAVHPDLELVGVATHRLLPKSEDPGRGERPEYELFQQECRRLNVPFIAADTRPLAADLGFASDLGSIDLICSVSWRFLLSPEALSLPRLGAINLHRGALPRYAGAEPVRRMLEDGCDHAEITAHLMVEKVDSGPVLATVRHPVSPLSDTHTLSDHVDRVVESLLPLYAPLMSTAIDSLVKRNRGRDAGEIPSDV